MTANNNPINPPPELVQQWAHLPADWNTVAPLIAQWGADQELDACCEWINSFQNKFVHAHDLRLVRRPKLPSLKEQALMGLSRIESTGEFFSDGMKDLATIRRALEQLND
jgi:hypothetical protein